MSKDLDIPLHTETREEAFHVEAWSKREDFKGISALAEGLLRKLWQHRRRMAVFTTDIGLVALSYGLSILILAQHHGLQWARQVFFSTFHILLGYRMGSLVGFRLFERPLRYASIPDLLCIGFTVWTSTILFYVSMKLLHVPVEMPLALFITDWALAQFFLGGSHFSVRIYKAKRATSQRGSKRVLIVGAGDAAINVLKELLSNPQLSLRPVAMVDDDPQKKGDNICGVSVLGSTRDLARVVREERVEEVLICIPSATRSEISQILSSCLDCGVPVRTLPSLGELIDGRVSSRELRRPRIEDILHREEIPNDPAKIRELVGGRTVLVSGAGGSIGSELCRQIASGAPRSLLLLDKSENSLFYINLELQERFSDVQKVPLLFDLIHENHVQKTFRKYRPEIVFHAAAFKHVALCELYPHQAIHNNVIGTRNVALAALEYGTQRFVNISTDKAVSPTNYMGISKKFTELLVKELSLFGTTRFVSVRFGNVAGSTGSVVRLFWDQIQKGGPLQVTDPRASRYFMAIPEAVYLILRAAKLGKGGETFVLDMGEPINIYELARTISLLAGFSPNKELPIQLIGLKEGEKMSEQLWEEWEQPQQTTENRIMAIYQQDGMPFRVLEEVEHFKALLEKDQEDGLLLRLKYLVSKFESAQQIQSPVLADRHEAPQLVSTR